MADQVTQSIPVVPVQEPPQRIIPLPEGPALSPEAEELLERTPSRLLHLGLYAVIAALGILVLIALYVRYPDTLEGKVTLTTDPLPIRIKAQTGGRVLDVFAQEGQLVTEGEVLAEIENPVGLKSMNALTVFCAGARHALENSYSDSLATWARQEFHLPGEVQQDYNRLLQNISAYLLLKEQHIYHKRIRNLKDQQNRFARLAEVSDEESRLINEELRREEAFFESKKKLFEEKVISRKEYYEEAAALAQKKRALKAQQVARIQSGISEGQNDKQLLDITFEQKEREDALVLEMAEQIRNLQSYVQSWRLKYLVTAPYKGHVYELRPLQRNEVIASGDELYIVTPLAFRYTAYALIPAASSGKIRTGQPVQLQLDQFPFNEYGYIEGKVSHISHTPQTGVKENEIMYRVQIQLPDSLYTSYHIRVPFSPEMSGTVRIIARDKNLLQRLLDNIAAVNR